MSNRLHCDFETRSAVELRDAGVYVYAEHDSTDVWCMAYALNEEPVKLWLPGDPCPEEVVRGVKEGWIFIGHNSAFERIIWRVMARKYGWPQPKLEQWRCTMAMAAAMALPLSLENAAAAVGLTFRKDMDGHATMLRMAKPRRARKGELPNGVYWFDDEERKARLYAYCRNDVEVERQLEKRLLALRPFEQRLWHLDQRINDRGVYVDEPLCAAALKVVAQSAEWLNDEMRVITKGKVTACSNVGEISEYINERGVECDSIAKDAIEQLLLADLPDDVRRVLELRREAAKASVAKIETLLEGKNKDGRTRGLLQYHAASTGRWGGRRFQPQNIKRPKTKDVDGAIAAVATGSADYVQMLYGEPLSVVGDTVRGMLRAAPGKQLDAADFSNIEGRVIAWLAGEDWKLDAFRAFDAGKGHDIYKLAYARAFGIAPEAVDDAQRQIGKVMELALGFEGGVGAFQQMAAGYGVKVTDERADELKVAWREAHPNVWSFWGEIRDAAHAAVKNKGQIVHCGKLKFRVAGSFLFMLLPSGRAICYPYPEIVQKAVPWKNPDGSQAFRPALKYKGVDSYTRKWGDCFAHGGLLFNNAVQGTARDVMAEAMVRVEDAGYAVVLTVHDEIVCEIDEGFGSSDEFKQLMVELPKWASGLPVAAGAWRGMRYRK